MKKIGLVEENAPYFLVNLVYMKIEKYLTREYEFSRVKICLPRYRFKLKII